MWSIVFVLVILVVLFAGLRIVRHQERWIIELFGRYHRTLRPGLNWVFPWITQRREVVNVWEQMVPLFEKGAKIDFKDGSATPVGAEVYVKIKDPDRAYSMGNEKPRDGVYRAVYEIEDWEKAVANLIGNAVRTFLNRFTIDEAITHAKAGYDLSSPDKDRGLDNYELGRITAVLEGWGFELRRITIQDFVLEPDLVAARGRVQIQRRAADAAKFLAEQRAEEAAGAVIEMFCLETGMAREEVQRQLKNDPQKFISAYKAAWQKNWDLVHRQLAIDGKSFVDIRVDGAGGIEKTLLTLIAAWKRMPPGN